MKGIILAAGNGTRLRPLTNVISKVLLPVYDKPMIYYAIEKLRNVGITEIAIVISPQHEEQYKKQLEEENITFIIQNNPKGTGHAIQMTEEFSDGDSIAVVYGDNIFDDELDVSGFTSGLRLFLRVVDDPKRFGVVTLDKDDPKKITEIIEKPENPKSNLAVLGMYLYDNDVYKHLKNLKPSPRGEYEITDIHDLYAKEGKATFKIIKGFWSDAGNPDTLFEVNEWAKKKFGQ
jgi:glucose-1-phosphate thymidylyltransferase